jgi:magnesium transporter
MSKRRRKRGKYFSRRTAPGAPPGVVAVDPGASPTRVQVMAFGPEGIEERTVADPASLREFLSQWPITWVNVEGLGDAHTIQELGRIFHLHPLALEDVVNVHQRAKAEQYQEHLFMVARMVEYNGQLETEQLSLFLGRNFVVTFVEDPGDSFNPVRQRLRGGHERLRASGTAYLAYSLLDAVISSTGSKMQS